MKFLAEDDTLTITFEGWEMFFALRRKFVFSRDQIADLQWQPSYQIPVRLWRLGGTDIPLTLWAGTFFGGGKRHFLYVHHPGVLSWVPSAVPLQNILVISLKSGFYQQLIMTTDPDIGASLLNWWRQTTAAK